MAQLIITASRTDNSQPWFTLTSNLLSMLTSDQLSVLQSTDSNMQSVPGYQTTSMSYPDDLTMTITHTFDTIENAQNAHILFTQSPANTFFHERDSIIRTLRQYANVNYTYTQTVI